MSAGKSTQQQLMMMLTLGIPSAYALLSWHDGAYAFRSMQQPAARKWAMPGVVRWKLHRANGGAVIRCFQCSCGSTDGNLSLLPHHNTGQMLLRRAARCILEVPKCYVDVDSR
jgi:hypothetical protein